MELLNRYTGCLLGLATGDALGAPVEFLPRGSFPPVTEMTQCTRSPLPAGGWTDDTAMALCLADSLLEKNGFDARDQMDRYVKWLREGYMSHTGFCVGIGSITHAAIERYRRTNEPLAGPTDPLTAGNGSIMRLAPVPMFFHPHLQQVIHYSVESSRTTHGTQECLDACRLLGGILHRALAGEEKDAVLLESDAGAIASPSIAAIARGEYRVRPEPDILGSGYVVPSLEAALWCFWVTGSFEQAVMKAVNLGDDADTTAAICGQVAGAFYGEPAIPPRWLEPLIWRDKIRQLAVRIFHQRPGA